MINRSRIHSILPGSKVHRHNKIICNHLISGTRAINFDYVDKLEENCILVGCSSRRVGSA